MGTHLQCSNVRQQYNRIFLVVNIVGIHQLGQVTATDGLPWWLSGKESACNAGVIGLIPGSGRSPGEGNGNPLQYPAWRIPWTEESGATVHEGRYSPWCHKRVGHDLTTKTTTDTDRMLRLKKFTALMSFMFWTSLFPKGMLSLKPEVKKNGGLL